MRCLVLCPRFPSRHGINAAGSIYKVQEFRSLCESLITLEVVEVTLITIKQINVATFLGKGAIAQTKNFINENQINLLLIDVKLSPIQQRNLEKKLSVKVLDRTGLILEIFGERAQTREGVLQVELAHLEYQKSRLVRSWTHLERQRGGTGFLGGPGETQIESDRRVLSKKISKIKMALQKVVSTRRLQRNNRKKNGIPIISLVGYTNAGKSSLFNALTGSSVLVKNMLFSTLDPTMRSFNLLGVKKAILSDTVGFISNLPTNLISAFKATLEDVVNSDIILHVRDISHDECVSQANDVIRIIDELDWTDAKKPLILDVYNKIDLLEGVKLQALIDRFANDKKTILVSARDRRGLDYLERQLKRALETKKESEELFISYCKSKRYSWLLKNNIITEESIQETGFQVKVLWTKEQRALFYDM